jgi:error-prone DNA polymerase
VTRDVVENLILCGAFDSLEPNRRALYWELEAALAARAPARAEEHPILDFGFWTLDSPGRSQSKIQNPKSKIPMPSLFERVKWEVEVLGLSPTVHPTVLFREQLAPYRPRRAAALARLPHGARVTTAGTVICRMRPPTRSGTTVVFITLEDETGLIDTVLFPTVYDQYGAVAFASDLLVVEGKLQREGARALTLILEKVINPLEGWVEPSLDGRTGVPRREVALPEVDGEEPPHGGEQPDRVRELPAPYGQSILVVATA